MKRSLGAQCLDHGHKGGAFPPRPSAARPATAGRLYFSGTPEADAHPAGIHQDRHLPGPLSEAQHLFHGLGVFQHVPVNDFKTFLTLGLPGLDGKGSGLLPEDGDFGCHGSLPNKSPKSRP